MDNRKQLKKAANDAIDEAAVELGISREEAIDKFLAELRQITRKRKFGSMPEEYDPSQDPSHPMNGWKP